MAIILRTLGHIDLRDAAGDELRGLLTQPKRLAVLVYLASTATTHMCRRDTLLGMFWPESDGARARASLRQTLHFIRQEAGADTIATRGTDEIGVRPGTIVLDACEVDRLANAGRHADALVIYEGDFLDGFFVRGAPVFERWVDGERDRLRRRAAESAWAVVEARIAAGDHAHARAMAERAVRLSGDNEVAVRRFITLLTSSGDYAGAAVAYQSFATQLGREFGIGPSAETSSLFESLAQPRRPIPRLEPTAATRDWTMSTTGDNPPHTPPADASARPDGRTIARRHWLGRMARWTAPIVLLGLAAFVALRSDVFGKRAGTNVQRVVVMPFVVTGGAELRALRDALPLLLSARLDGVDELRAVDPRAVLAEQTRRGADSVNPAMGEETAERLAAAFYIVGAISGSAAAMRLDVALYDRRRPSAPIARARVDGREADLVALVDSATARLLADRVRTIGARAIGGRGRY